MITLREASYEDCELIRAMAQKSFPATYASILTREQISYMMEMMYSRYSEWGTIPCTLTASPMISPTGIRGGRLE